MKCARRPDSCPLSGGAQLTELQKKLNFHYVQSLQYVMVPPPWGPGSNATTGAPGAARREAALLGGGHTL
eukprot:16044705-Heterocapsa_arctica.AAC.1